MPIETELYQHFRRPHLVVSSTVFYKFMDCLGSGSQYRGYKIRGGSENITVPLFARREGVASINRAPLCACGSRVAVAHASQTSVPQKLSPPHIGNRPPPFLSRTAKRKDLAIYLVRHRVRCFLFEETMRYE